MYDPLILWETTGKGAVCYLQLASSVLETPALIGLKLDNAHAASQLETAQSEAWRSAWCLSACQSATSEKMCFITALFFYYVSKNPAEMTHIATNVEEADTISYSIFPFA